MALVLPPNFDKYSNLVKYYQNHGIDCLSSHTEWCRFFICYVKGFLSTRAAQLRDKNNNNPRWGIFQDKNGPEYCDINNHIYRDHRKRGYNLSTGSLYEEMSKIESEQLNIIMDNYFREIQLIIIIKPIVIDETRESIVIIENEHNDSKIVLKRRLFKQFCKFKSSSLLNYQIRADTHPDDKYNNIIRSIHIYTSNLLFNDNIALYVTGLIHSSSIEEMNKILLNSEELITLHKILDALSITFIDL